MGPKCVDFGEWHCFLGMNRIPTKKFALTICSLELICPFVTRRHGTTKTSAKRLFFWQEITNNKHSEGEKLARSQSWSPLFVSLLPSRLVWKRCKIVQNAQKAFLKLSSTAFPRRKYGWWISANGGIVEIWRRQNILRYFPTTGLFFCWFLKVISLCWFPTSFCLSMIRENQFSLNPNTQK